MCSMFKFELNGLTSLLMHQDDVEQADRLIEAREQDKTKAKSTKGKAGRAGDDRCPAWTWSTYLYRDDSDDANVAIPYQNIMTCLRQAGARIILSKQTTFKSLSQSGLQLESEYCDFYADGKRVKMSDVNAIRDLPFDQQAEAVKGLGFDLFVKRATIGTAKHVRVRPRFKRWSIRGAISIVSDQISAENLAQMFDIAGKSIGLGDWRPGCKTPGPHGQFKATLIPA